MTENQLSEIIIGCAIKVHKALGAGLLEHVYQECLYCELQKAGIAVEKEKPLPVFYESIRMEIGYRVDLFVAGKVIVELKAVEVLNDVHLAQVLTYLKLADCRLGLLINFNVARLTQGLRRVVNNLNE